jgi:hypothetical protein
MFFTIVDFEEGAPEDQPFDYESEIDLANDQGRIVISFRANKQFARTLTANFLGIEEDAVNENDLEDSVQELTNMVGGGYHSRMHDGHWQLGIPIVRTAGIEPPNKTRATAGLRFATFGKSAGSVMINYLPY